MNVKIAKINSTRKFVGLQYKLCSTMYLYVDRAENVHFPKFSRMPCNLLNTSTYFSVHNPKHEIDKIIKICYVNLDV